MPCPFVAVIAPLLGTAPAPGPGVAGAAVLVGGLLALAADEDAAVGPPALRLLGLAAGGGLALALANALAAIVPSLLRAG